MRKNCAGHLIHLTFIRRSEPGKRTLHASQPTISFFPFSQPFPFLPSSLPPSLPSLPSFPPLITLPSLPSPANPTPPPPPHSTNPPHSHTNPAGPGQISFCIPLTPELKQVMPSIYLSIHPSIHLPISQTRKSSFETPAHPALGPYLPRGQRRGKTAINHPLLLPLRKPPLVMSALGRSCLLVVDRGAECGRGG